ncbi:hypothetical protein RHODGE_RHODGE_00475 [Rhodoplanes serenus]|uniref:Tyr recombinase domain-containing protein n=1 Tax=Rhodoplanes serenus TaxID=200615 RepID=A0A447CQI2_9BRAD|nr:hypothetical protein [Rhodoplanes serenus]VCU06557.1 hypothetical protein RHODPL_RHODPL_00005 [Rhodoplanes serenus]VCU07376.1 hypothetical protein RHODGE_RHODGE_00475 [Rhodoplanes serenus]
MGKDKVRYLVFVNGRWRWRPTRKMRSLGFRLETFGTALTAEDKARALALNDDWDLVRRGLAPAPRHIHPAGSVGEAYERAMALRAAERKAKGIAWDRAHEARDDWPRAWKWLDPAFGDVNPARIEPEDFLFIDPATGEAAGLLPKIEHRVSAAERHRVVKVWRALWKRMARMGYCDIHADPSLAITNTAPPPRQAVWTNREVLRLVQRAWRTGKPGLAALMAVTWDTMLSPGDARRLTAGQMARDAGGAVFFVDRAKTGRAAAGTLSQWSDAILSAYLRSLGVDLLDTAPLFRTAGSEPGPRGGRRWGPQPYTKDKADKDFRAVRTALFGLGETRQFADMRRSGAVEADAGGARVEDLSNKMANTIHASARLRKTYTPVNVPSVRRVDDARALGRARLRKGD